MGFKAQDAVAALEWNFRPFVDASGTSPEPSDQAINRFRRRYFRVIEAIKGEGMAALQKMEESADQPVAPAVTLRDGLATMEAFLTEPDADFEKLQEVTAEISKAVAEVCSDSPNFEQIEALPSRPRQMFFGWIVGQLLLPEYGADVLS